MIIPAQRPTALIGGPNSRSSDRRRHLSEPIVARRLGCASRYHQQGEGTNWLVLTDSTGKIQSDPRSTGDDLVDQSNTPGACIQSCSLRTIFERAANRSPFARSRIDDIAIDPGNALASNPGFWRGILLDHRVYRQNG